jgi:propanol-preferring alcohol dehydrogenase
MLLRSVGRLADRPDPLVLADVPEPRPGAGEVLIAVTVVAVCHTDLDIIEGRTPPRSLPAILGHQVVGRIAELGPSVSSLSVGDRVGVAWIGGACGHCEWCRGGRENLCPDFEATGRDRPGGYAERLAARAAFVHPVPDAIDDLRAAPLLCAGAIGYRSLVLAGVKDGDAVGLTGFGASGHLMLQLVARQYPKARVHVFARSETERAFALSLGAKWAGGIGDEPPEPLHAIIDTTPVWRPMVEALAALRPGGRLVVNAIRKESVDQAALLELDYPRHLWLEKEIKSVANVTRADVRDFLAVAARNAIVPEVQEYPLSDANRALSELRAGGIRGAKVLRVASSG